MTKKELHFGEKEADALDSIYELALATVAETGIDFLSELVKGLHSVMPVSLAFIARAYGDPISIACAKISWAAKGQDTPSEYDLEGTPCRLVYGGETLVIPEGLAEKFPIEKDFESYCGVPLKGPKGEIYGHFVVFSKEVVSNPKKVEVLMRIFGMRAAVELQRLERDAEREATLEQLRNQQDILHKANVFKSNTLGMVAHDLRNPLATIIARTELLQQVLPNAGKDEPDIKNAKKGAIIEKSLMSVMNAADRMDYMIKSLLDSARVEISSIELEKTNVDIASLINSAIRLVKTDANNKKIQITSAQPDNIIMMLDENRMREVIVNLLTNAIKYSDTGSDILIKAMYDTSNGVVVISVCDNGLGMTAADIALAFRPFQTLSAQPTAGEKSTGLGLAIVKSVVEAHAGAVQIQSDGLGAGTTFYVEIPFVEG